MADHTVLAKPGLDGEMTTKPLVLLLTFGTGGDLQPFVVLAAALAARGYRTLLVVQRSHEQVVRATGLPYVVFGTHEQSEAVLDDPDLWDERKGLGVVWRGLLPSLDEIRGLLISHAQAGDCVVLSHPFLVPVAAMAKEQQAHLRIVCAYLAPSTLRTVHDPLTVGSLNVPTWVPTSLRRALWWAIDTFWIDPDLLPGLNTVRAAQGLKPVASFLAHMETASDASVALFPAWFASRQPDWPDTFVGGHFPLRSSPPLQRLPAELEDFLAAGDAPIAFTAGTGHRHANGFFANALTALRALGRRGLFLTTFGDQLPSPLPSDVRWQPHAPFDLLLPRVALLVHHGGIGTTAEALRAGVPQLILPFAFDQFDNGRRVQNLNAGGVVPASRANALRLRQEMESLLVHSMNLPTWRLPSDLSSEATLEQLVDSVELAFKVSAESPGPS